MKPILNRIGGFLGPLAGGFDDSALRLRYVAMIAFLLFMFPFSILFLVGGLLPRPFAWTASVVIVVTGLVTLISELRTSPPVAGLFRFGILFVLLFSVELLGLHTGYPFGDYFYTDTLRFALLGVPIAIPFAWYGTVINTWRIGEIVAGPGPERFPWRIALVAGLLTVALDLVLEPMASFANSYWLWSGAEVPWQNYAAWFVLGTAAVAWCVWSANEVHDTGEAVRGRRANGVLLFSMQWTLFVLTDLVHGHIGAVILSVAFLAVALVVGGNKTLALRRALRGDT